MANGNDNNKDSKGVAGTADNDVLTGDDKNNKLYGLDGDDLLEGLAGNDHLFGDAGNDQLSGGKGNDQLHGGAGDDRVVWQAGDGNDTNDGGDGSDTYVLRSSDLYAQHISLQSTGNGKVILKVQGEDGGNLTLQDFEDFQLQVGLGGISLDVSQLAPGTFLTPLALAGGAGGDAIDLSSSSDPVAVDAGAGDDKVSGGSAADQLSGGDGADIISGGGGDDVIDAGVGDDTVLWQAGDGNDTIDGGEGIDAVDLKLSDSLPGSLSISADAAGNVILLTEDGSQLTLDGVEDIVINAGNSGATITIGDLTGTDIAQDTLYFVGGSGDDYVDASATDRRINASGGLGADVLLSGSGNDILDGGAGNDYLDAGSGLGVDTVLGGSGDDAIAVTLGDEQGSSAIDIVDGGDDTDTLQVHFVEPTSHDLVLRVRSNGDGTFNITSEDLGGFVINEAVHVSHVEQLAISAGEGALNFELDSLSATTLTDGVSFTGSADADSFDASGTDVTTNQFGAGGDDNLIGGAVADYLSGGEGNDSLVANAGDDVLVGGAGDDLLDGGVGQDTADYSAATAGVTVDLNNTAAQDTGSAGFDTLQNIEVLVGSEFADTLTGNDGFNILNGGAGDDVLSDAPGNGILIGGAGNDTLDGDVSYADDQSGVAINLSSDAVDTNDDGNADLAANTANDGYGDQDSLGSNVFNVLGSQFSDYLTGSAGDNLLRGAAGNDVINALAGDDSIIGGSGDDIIDGGDGFDYLNFIDQGFDAVGSATQGVSVNLTTGEVTDDFGNSDQVSNIEGVIGSNFADLVHGDENNNTFIARAGNDELYGHGGQDIINGGAGNDTIDGGDGEDTINGDIGDDILTGGANADFFQFATFTGGGGLPSGHDTITDFSVSEDVINLAPFGIANLAGVQAIATDDGTDTVINIDTEQSITLFNVTVAQLTASNFAFDTSNPPSGPIVGTESDDSLEGTVDDDVIQGLGGTDFLRGYEGADYLDGGDGQDRLYGGPGNDVLDGGNLADFAMYIEDPAGVYVNINTGLAQDGYGDVDNLISIENILGSAFDDVIIGNDSTNFIFGSSGHDLIDGRGGTDRIFGGSGDDEIHTGADGADFVDGGPGNDEIYGDAFAWDNINGGDGNDLLIDPAGTGILTGGAGNDSIDGRPGYESDPAGIIINFGSGDWDVYGDGSTVVAARTAIDGYGDTDILLAGARDLNASNFADYVFGSDFQEFYDLRGGDDVAFGQAGDDYFRGGSGNDTIDGGDGFNGTDYWDDGFDAAGAVIQGVVVNLSAADFAYDWNGQSGLALAGQAVDGWGDVDTLFNIDAVNGSDRDDVIVGHDQHNWLWGGLGNDQIYGGGDGDNLIGYAGNDLLDGQDGEWDTAWYDVGDVNNGVVVNLADGATYEDGFGGQDTLVSIENVRGTHFDDSIVGNEFSNNLEGLSGNDTLSGGGSDDWLYGHDGDDELFGGDGNDWLHGEFGTDLLDGGAGAHDWANYAPWRGTTSGVTVDLSAVVASAGGYSNVVVVNGDGFGGIDYLRNIENVNGTDYNDVLTGDALNNEFFGYAGADTLDGGAGDDYLQGDDGNDTLVGGIGNDTLAGGENNDTLTGGSGLDQFRFRSFTNEGNLTSFGEDVITDFNVSEDILDLYSTAQFFNITDLQNAASQSGNDVVISISTNTGINGDAETNSITLQGLVLADLESMQIWYTPVAGTEGDDELFAPANGANVEGRGGNDILNGSAGRDGLDGGTGDDELYGNGGDDWLRGGEGTDILDGGAGWDHVDFSHWTGVTQGVVIDLSSNQASNDGFGFTDTLINIESISGSGFDDHLTGDNNDNYLGGGAGNDTFVSTGGNDFMQGDDGDDQFFVYSGTGNAGMQGGAGNDLFYLSDDRHASIDDFEAGPGTNDVIDLSAVSTLNDFSAVSNAANDDTWGNTNIDLGNGYNLHLVGVSTSQLHADDFSF